MPRCGDVDAKGANMEYQHVTHGFDPVFDERSRVLVLGSFPSVLSRENDFYYGNPRNRFWDVMASCLDARPVYSVEEKRALLLEHGIALWDVIAECDIRGSSDTSIANVAPVEIERILTVAPICHVVCNGGTAGRLYAKHLQGRVGLSAVILPSTSPANASWTLERLKQRWCEVLASML